MFSFIIHTVRQPVSLKKLALRRCAQCRDSIKMIAVGGISVTRKWNEDNGTFKSHPNIKWKSIRFAIGGDGKVYEGRGFNVLGAHSPKYNDISIGICLIGNWEGKQTINCFLLQIILLVKNQKNVTLEPKKIQIEICFPNQFICDLQKSYHHKICWTRLMHLLHMPSNKVIWLKTISWLGIDKYETPLAQVRHFTKRLKSGHISMLRSMKLLLEQYIQQRQRWKQILNWSRISLCIYLQWIRQHILNTHNTEY